MSVWNKMGGAYFWGMSILLVGFLTSSGALGQEYGTPDKLKDFVGRPDVLTHLEAMEAMGLKSHAIPELPWADTYWPDNTGSIASPYEDFGFQTPIFGDCHRTVLWKQLKDLKAGKFDKFEWDYFSPAVKYDLLIGDLDFNFTQKVLEKVDFQSANNQTATWSGICHGWAPASLALPRPLHAFSVTGADGKSINFYPSDVKALASFLWADSFAQDFVKVEGFQCKSGAKRDKTYRLKDPACFDVNPAFFHLLMVNQLGLKNQGLIVDRDYKSGVRNQPVFSYQYAYYNRETKKKGGTLKESIVRLGGKFQDPYKEYRSPRATQIVGVRMKLKYRTEESPNHKPVIKLEDEDDGEMALRYDLELDDSGEIVGGEWVEYQDPTKPNGWDSWHYEHPDIVWLVPDGLKAWSIADLELAGWNWTERNGFTAEEQKVLVEASLKASQAMYIISPTKKRPNPQPLAYVVDFLIGASRR